MRSTRNVFASQTLAVSSRLALAKYRPSGLHAISATPRVWSVSTASITPVRALATVIALCQPATATRFPLGSNAILASSPPIENGRPSRRPLATSHTDTCPQNVPAATIDPSALKGCERQPEPQSVVPSFRKRPFLTFSSTSPGFGPVGLADGFPL